MKNQQLRSVLGRKIKTVRVLRGITQSQLATILFCDRTTVSKIENGKIDPGIMVFAIARSLDCSVEALNPFYSDEINILDRNLHILKKSTRN